MTIDIKAASLVESFPFDLQGKTFEIRFYKAYENSPNENWQNVLTPVFFCDGEQFHEYDTLWDDLRETFDPASMAQRICQRFNDYAKDLLDSDGDGDPDALTWEEELLFVMRTRVLLEGTKLVVEQKA